MTNDTRINREGDLVLIHYQDKPALYGRIESIDPDIKKDWYQVGLLLLTIPAQRATWILREEYINGVTFTMGGESLRLERIPPGERSETPDPTPQSNEDEKASKVIPFKRQE
jgi:hypothetical protein